MTEWLLDTNHASAMLLQQPKVLARRSNEADRIYLCVPVVAELWYMIFNSERVEHNRRRLEAFLGEFRILPFGEVEAEEFGRIRAECRRSGRRVPAFDTQIASIARLHGLTIATADAHFSFISNLTTENWLT